MNISTLRKQYHREICAKIIRIQSSGDVEYPNFADGSNANSRAISWGIVELLGCPQDDRAISGQSAGKQFEIITKNFLERAFSLLIHLRPGNWIYSTNTPISKFEQYEHLAYLDTVIKKDSKLEAALRGGYIIAPDIIVGRWPVDDEEINAKGNVVESSSNYSCLTPLRKSNRPPSTQILHASISCKWTIRSDRAQNTRTEALNLIRNRKGPLPHVVAVTAEPTPHRLASLALGTGDLDCVYHFALHELIASIEKLKLEDALAEIQMMIEGKRLRDISDLPFDLAI